MSRLDSALEAVRRKKTSSGAERPPTNGLSPKKAKRTKERLAVLREESLEEVAKQQEQAGKLCDKVAKRATQFLRRRSS